VNLTRYPVLDVDVQALTVADLHKCISEAVARGERWIIANHNLHSLYLYHHYEKMREFYSKAKIVYVDGMSIIWLGKLLGQPFKPCHRVTYMDWIGPLTDEALKQHWRIFFLGSRPGVASRASEILRESRPDLTIASEHGYFDSRPESQESQAVLERINSFAPHILMIGMGMPKQEEWICDNLERLNANAILNAGACMDYIAGEQSLPPRWLGRLGLEWLYRLGSEPGRLWSRYLVEPWYLLALLGRVWLRKRRVND